jgi:hypothetical protein
MQDEQGFAGWSAHKRKLDNWDLSYHNENINFHFGNILAVVFGF